MEAGSHAPADRRVAFAPGASILGGAAAGLSYEGAVRDAVAREDLARRRQDAALRATPPPPLPQQRRREAPDRRMVAEQAAMQAGR
jgi:hypothetical protein